MVEGSPMRFGIATGLAGLRLACGTSPRSQPFWAKTVGVYWPVCRSLGRVKRVSEAVVLWVPYPVAVRCPCPCRR